MLPHPVLLAQTVMFVRGLDKLRILPEVVECVFMLETFHFVFLVKANSVLGE
jgi:hypothetical protein